MRVDGRSSWFVGCLSFVVCCALCNVCCSLCVVCYVWGFFVVHCCVDNCLWLVVGRDVLVVCCLLAVVYCCVHSYLLLVVGRDLLVVNVCCLLCVV